MGEFIRSTQWLASVLKPLIWIVTFALAYTIARSYHAWRKYRTDWPAGHPWNLVFLAALVLSQTAEWLAPPSVWRQILSVLFLIIGFVSLWRTVCDMSLLRKVTDPESDKAAAESSQEDKPS
jgi:uncharacterized membrane protein YfcA